MSEIWIPEDAVYPTLSEAWRRAGAVPMGHPALQVGKLVVLNYKRFNFRDGYKKGNLLRVYPIEGISDQDRSRMALRGRETIFSYKPCHVIPIPTEFCEIHTLLRAYVSAVVSDYVSIEDAIAALQAILPKHKTGDN